MFTYNSYNYNQKQIYLDSSLIFTPKHAVMDNNSRWYKPKECVCNVVDKQD